MWNELAQFIVIMLPRCILENDLENDCPNSIVIAGLSMNSLNVKYTFHGHFVRGQPMWTNNGQRTDKRWTNRMDEIYSISFKRQSKTSGPVIGGSGNWIIGLTDESGFTDELVRSPITNTKCPDFGSATEEWCNDKWSVIPDPSVIG